MLLMQCELSMNSLGKKEVGLGTGWMAVYAVEHYRVPSDCSQTTTLDPSAPTPTPTQIKRSDIVQTSRTQRILDLSAQQRSGCVSCYYGVRNTGSSTVVVI